jgi:hypothetical protein
MYLYIFVGALILSAASCRNQYRASSQNIDTNSNLVSKTPESKTENYKTENDELVEFFSDDSNIGVPGKNKIEISNFKKSNGNIAVIKFYSLGENKDWKLKQTFEFEKEGIPDGDPKLEDFNNDSLKDITYVSNVAARGANELRRLFIYDKKKDQLIYIKDSQEYPNLQYNKELDCLDAWLFHGGVTTVFLRIDGDSLKKLASIEHRDNDRAIHVIDKNGKAKLLRKDKISQDDFYTRYKNFDPPQPYESTE